MHYYYSHFKGKKLKRKVISVALVHAGIMRLKQDVHPAFFGLLELYNVVHPKTPNVFIPMHTPVSFKLLCFVGLSRQEYKGAPESMGST